MPELSPRQLDILSCIVASLSEDEIAARLNLTRDQFQHELSGLLRILADVDSPERLEIAEQVAQHQLDVIQDELRTRGTRRKKK